MKNRSLVLVFLLLGIAVGALTNLSSSLFGQEEIAAAAEKEEVAVVVIGIEVQRPDHSICLNAPDMETCYEWHESWLSERKIIDNIPDAGVLGANMIDLAAQSVELVSILSNCDNPNRRIYTNEQVSQLLDWNTDLMKRYLVLSVANPTFLPDVTPFLDIMRQDFENREQAKREACSEV